MWWWWLVAVAAGLVPGVIVGRWWAIWLSMIVIPFTLLVGTALFPSHSRLAPGIQHWLDFIGIVASTVIGAVAGAAGVTLRRAVEEVRHGDA